MNTRKITVPVLVLIAFAFTVTSFTLKKRKADSHYKVKTIYKNMGDSIRTASQDSLYLLAIQNPKMDTVNQTDENGLKQGYWIIYGKMKPEKGYGAECKIEEGTYKDNKKNGTWVKYHKKCNVLRLIGEYRNNRPQGHYTKYYEDGKIVSSGEYSSKKEVAQLKSHSNAMIQQTDQLSKQTNKLEANYFIPNTTSNNAYYTSARDKSAQYAYSSNNGMSKGTATRYYPNGDTKRVIAYNSEGAITDKEKREAKESYKRYESHEMERISEIKKAQIVNEIHTEKTTLHAPAGAGGVKKDGKSFETDGYNKLYDKNNELWMDGTFKGGRIYNGKVYKYDSNGILTNIEIWKNGKYHSDGQLEGGEPITDPDLPKNNIDEEDGLAGEAQQLSVIPDKALHYERYNPYNENQWVKAQDEAKSTFGIDVDNASYTNFRRFIKGGYLPPKDAIRVEEWLNFFNYDLNAPDEDDEHPLKIESEIGACPWAPEDDLVMIKLQGKLRPKKKKALPPSNLVFLVDASGSMKRANKLPLVQSSMKILLESLRPEDNISIVTYAGSSKIVLEPTAGDKTVKITEAIDGITAGGGTHGSKGLLTAYELAEKNLDPNGNNRVIIATDGDWNIGVTKDGDLKKLIEEKRESGIFLSVLGFGMYNLNDKMMEMLADNGNGNYAYIDEEKEAHRIFKDEFAGTMHTIAKDVKLQVIFDPEVVESYRLLGYENRVLENWQFDDDAIDAGDLGMGQNVIAFYQIKRKKGQRGSLGKLDFRYKQPLEDVSTKLTHEFANRTDEVSSDFNFASCVIEFAMCLCESEYRGDAQMERAIQRGRANLGDESNKLSYEKRVEFVGISDNTSEIWEEYVIEEAPDQTFGNKPELKIYPNPADEHTTVEVPEDLMDNWSVQIFGMNGALEHVQHFQESTTGRLDITKLTPGTYIIKVYQAGFNFGYLRLVKT